MLRRGKSMAFGTVTLLLALGAAQAAAPALPDDARLGPARERLEALVAKTSAAGLPAEVVVSKVREGLAKGVDAGRIEQAANRLAESLGAASRFVAERRPGAAPPAPLVRALAEARVAGLDLNAADAVVRSNRQPAETARAVEVLTDLALRGYPAVRASSVVRDVLTRDPGAMARLPSALETIRQDQALTHVETVDALSRGLAGSNTLEAAYKRTLDDERRRAPARGRPNQGEDREPAGKSGIIPPGLKKMNGKPGRQGRNY
jgi:hypothetical protein